MTIPGDIRDIAPEEYWKALRGKWGALAAYRYIGRHHTRGREIVLRHDMRNAAGGVMAAPLCITSPEAGGFSDENAVPNPLIASMQILDAARDVRAVNTRSEVVHTGRRMGFSRTTIFDADDPARVIALSEGAGISLGDVPPGGDGQLDAGEGTPIEVEDRPGMPRLHEFFGGARDGVGAWTLPALAEEQASPDGALHIGPSHVILEAAATDLAHERAGTERLQIVCWHVMFVSRGKVGPFRTEGAAFGGDDGTVGARVTLLDEGNQGRAVSTASAVFRPS